MIPSIEIIQQTLNGVGPLFELLMDRAGQAIQTCGDGLYLYQIQAGDWITGLARTVAERLGVDMPSVLNIINESNGWASAPNDLAIGQGICLPQEYITAIQNAPQSATCPPGFPNCFTEGINTIQAAGEQLGGSINPISIDIPLGVYILGGVIGLALISGIVWSIRHRTQRE